MFNFGYINFYLGIEFICSFDGILYLQRVCVIQILKEFGMEVCILFFIFMIEGFNLDREDDLL